LRQDCIFRVADEVLDFEVLLDEPEKYFDLPALLVDVGDGPGGQGHEVGQELEMLSTFFVQVADASENEGFLAVADLDDLVGGDAG